MHQLNMKQQSKLEQKLQDKIQAQHNSKYVPHYLNK